MLVKFADRLHNMRTLGSLSQAKQLRVAQETQSLFAPLAHRFGLQAIKKRVGGPLAQGSGRRSLWGDREGAESKPSGTGCLHRFLHQAPKAAPGGDGV